MIGKCKAIAHGSTALDYIFREGKLGCRLAFHNLCSREPKSVYEEMKMVSDYNSRCRNKFLRIEIGIAPQDEKKLPVSELMRIAHLFAKRMGLDNHQWVAVTHKDTDNKHIHIIANRISLYGEVYDTTFVSNRAARMAEDISRKKGLTIAKEVKAKRKHKKAKAYPTREETKKELQRICYALLEKYKDTGITGHSMFLYELNRQEVTIERIKNRQGKVYGLKFSYGEYMFKASEVGREFGYRSLKKNFEPTNKEALKRPHQTIQEPIEKNEQPDTGYQLVPKSRSSISRDNDIPQMQSPIDAVADTAMSVVDEVLEGLGGMITPTAQGDDYAEAAWQRKLRYQVNRKKRGRKL
ncbi:relaxase/mobilization nuclease domain-containing protein [Prevotella koreensis]